MSDGILLLFLLIVALTMPLSRVQVPPLSVTVTGMLTLGLATLGKESAACSAAAPTDRSTASARVVDTKRPRGPATTCLFVDLRTPRLELAATDRKSTRLNSSHLVISYAVFCLKKKQ